MVAGILLFLYTFAALNGFVYQKSGTLLDYVDVMTGTDGASTISAKNKGGDHVDYGQTIPAVTAPFAMTQWTPQTRKSEKKCLAPFYFSDTNLQGFRATHWTSGSCVQDYGSFTIMAVSGQPGYLADQRQTSYRIDSLNCTPAYMRIQLPLYKIRVEMTATRRCGFFMFTWDQPVKPMIIIDVNSDEGQGFIKVDTARNEIYGYNPVHRIYNGNGKPAGFNGYFVARFDRHFSNSYTFAGLDNCFERKEFSGFQELGAYGMFNLAPGETVKVRFGTSFTSIENARENLNTEIPDWDFSNTKENLENSWNNLLGKIKAEGGTGDDFKKFYTALYHSAIHPRLYSDADGSYPGYARDTTVHKASGFEYYDDFSNWDIFRAQMPLISLIAPQAYQDMVNSLIVKADQGGWLPIFPMWNSYTSAMIGDHSIAVIGDAMMKGFRVDNENAWRVMRKNAFESPDKPEDYIDGMGRRSLDSYLQLGYIPLEDPVNYAFHRQEQVSRTLEYAYDDWVLAQVAKKLGKTEDYRILLARSRNYANVYDPEKGWVCGRFKNGSFTNDFDASGRMPYITEGTPKHYTWFVPHDVPGLIDLMGGSANFLSKLTGMIEKKEYWHGNEPSHHIPYLFNYAGKWDMTQKTVKYLLTTEYGNGPGGLSGNDDAGQMSAWYVFSAMGFYPVCPGSNQYQLSSPVFEKITLVLDKKFYPGGIFILKAEPGNQYGIFSTVNLNGKKSTPMIRHEDLQKGGLLEFGLK